MAGLCFLAPVAPALAQEELPASSRGWIVEVEFHSPALEGNLLGDAARRRVEVYLPPSYDQAPERRYPTVYLLHPFAGSSRNWTTKIPFGATLQDAMDSLIAGGAIEEMVVVMPNAWNAYGGSMYHNSIVTGRWEDYIANDLVTFIDGTYRTVPQAGRRAIAGHSMGAFGSLLLAMKRPDVFSAVYALSPPLLDLIDLLEDPAAWRRLLQYGTPAEVRQAYFEKGDFAASVLLSLAAAFTPNPEKPPFLADFPYRLEGGDLKRNQAVHARWKELVLVSRVADYRENLSQLKGIWIDYGDAEIELIRNGAERFAAALDELGIRHLIESYEGNHHSGIAERLRTRALPALSRVLHSPEADSRRAP